MKQNSEVKSLDKIHVHMSNGGVDYEILRKDSEYGPYFYLRVSLNHFGHEQVTETVLPPIVGLFLAQVCSERSGEFISALSRERYSQFDDPTVYRDGVKVTRERESVSDSYSAAAAK